MVSTRSFLLTTLSFGGLAFAEDLEDCGGAKYLPSQYSCYNGNFLCPVTNGEPSLRCGNACYSTAMYTCNNNLLATLPSYEGSFTLKASNPTQPFHGMSVEACSRHFYLGLNGPCTYCPDVVQPNCPAVKGTVLHPERGMDTMVPGGQSYYIEPNGALGFTQAHSSASPQGSVFGVSAFKNGAFEYLGGSGWVACKSTENRNKPTWQIFAKLPGLTFGDECVGTTLLINEFPDNAPGAWQYT